MTMTTHDIAQQLSQPTSKLLEWLYEQYARRWYGIATVRWGLDADSAWDVIYKTLDTLLDKRTSLPTDPPAYFENYLFKVFTNNLRQCLREQARREETMRLVPMNRDPTAETPNYLEDSVELSITDETYEKLLADEETQTQPMLARLETALAQLTETDQSLLLLKAQQFSYDEIAQMLGLENNQLKVRHYRAKQRLITLFNQMQP